MAYIAVICSFKALIISAIIHITTFIPNNPRISHGDPHSVIEMIGNTPMLELTQFDTGPCRLFVKLENQNPGGSIKDRVALSMIEQAERDGKLQPGGTIIEATAGNTGGVGAGGGAERL